MKKMLFVMNPYAGQRRANRYLVDILSIFNRAGYRVEAYMTGARGEATDIVRQYAPEMDLVRRRRYLQRDRQRPPAQQSQHPRGLYPRRVHQ